MTPATAQFDHVATKVGAHQLCDHALIDQYEMLLNWVLETPDEVAQSKFCIESAWFREVSWELRRRSLLVVH